MKRGTLWPCQQFDTPVHESGAASAVRLSCKDTLL